MVIVVEMDEMRTIEPLNRHEFHLRDLQTDLEIEIHKIVLSTVQCNHRTFDCHPHTLVLVIAIFLEVHRTRLRCRIRLVVFKIQLVSTRIIFRWVVGNKTQNNRYQNYSNGFSNGVSSSLTPSQLNRSLSFDESKSGVSSKKDKSSRKKWKDWVEKRLSNEERIVSEGYLCMIVMLRVYEKKLPQRVLLRLGTIVNLQNLLVIKIKSDDSFLCEHDNLNLNKMYTDQQKVQKQL